MTSTDGEDVSQLRERSMIQSMNRMVVQLY